MAKRANLIKISLIVTGIVLIAAAAILTWEGWRQRSVVDQAQVWGTSLALAVAAVTMLRYALRPTGNEARPAPAPQPSMVVRNRRFTGAVPRPGIVQEVVSALHTGQSIGAVALVGPGGFGKTWAADEASVAEDVVRLFPEAVLYVSLGPDISDAAVAAKINAMAAQLCTEPLSELYDPGAAATRLAHLLGSSRRVIWVDDVWAENQVEPFLVGAPNCFRIFTSRFERAVHRRAHVVRVGPMTRPESQAVLTARVGPSEEADALLAAVGGWPILMSLVNTQLRSRMSQGASLKDAVASVGSDLAGNGPAALDPMVELAGSQAVARVISSTLSHIEAHAPEGRRIVAAFRRLAVFPAGTELPLPALAKAWKGIWPDRPENTERVCQELRELSLVEYDSPSRLVRLHEVIGRFLQQSETARIGAWNSAFLANYRSDVPPAEGGGTAWWEMPPDEPYLWEHLVHHLSLERRTNPVAAKPSDIVCDVRWLAARFRSSGAPGAERDLRQVGTAEATELAQAVSRSGHLFAPSTTSAELEDTLMSLLSLSASLRARADAHASRLARPHLRATVSAAPFAERGLRRVLRAHGRVNALSASGDSHGLASGGADGTVRLWDVSDGTSVTIDVADPDLEPDIDPDLLPQNLVEAQRMLEKMMDLIELDRFGESLRDKDTTGAAQQLVAGSAGSGSVAVLSGHGAVRLFDTRTGRMTRHLADHESQLVGSPAGGWFVTVDLDGKLRVWDPSGRRLARRRLATGFDVHVILAVSQDGQWLAAGSSTSETGLLSVFSVEPGRRRRRASVRLRLTASISIPAVSEMSFTPDGTKLVVLGDQGIRLCDWRTRTLGAPVPLATEAGQTCVLAVRNDLAVAATETGAIHSYRLSQPARPALIGVHPEGVRALALAPDGTWFASGSRDGTIRIWDTEEVSRLTATGDPEIGVREFADGPGTQQVSSVGGASQVDVWDALSGNRDTRRTSIENVLYVAVPPRAGWLAVANDHEVEVQIDDGSVVVIAHLEDRIVGLGASLARWLAFVDNTGEVTVWDSRSRERYNTFRIPSNGLTKLAWLDEERLVTAGGDGVLRIWAAGRGEILQERSSHDAPIGQLLVTGTHIVTGDSAGGLGVWNARGRLDGAVVPVSQDAAVTAVAAVSATVFAGLADGHLVAVSPSQANVLWKRVEAHESAVRGIAPAPSGRLLVSVGADGRACTWTASGVYVSSIRLGSRLTTCRWLTDAGRICVGGYGGFYVLDQKTPRGWLPPDPRASVPRITEASPASPSPPCFSSSPTGPAEPKVAYAESPGPTFNVDPPPVFSPPTGRQARLLENLAAEQGERFMAWSQQLLLDEGAEFPLRWHRVEHLATATTAQPSSRDILVQYRAAPDGRLVVLGDAGAGKSSVAIRLARRLLETRQPGGVVPVLVPAADLSMDRPINLLDLIVDELRQTNQRVTRRDILAWMQNRQLLPIFDGLDECGEVGKSLAVLANGFPSTFELVVTCRSAEYAAAEVPSGMPNHRIPNADVIEMLTLDTGETASYLDSLATIHSNLSGLVRHLLTRPDAPLARALSSPWAVRLAVFTADPPTGPPLDASDLAQLGSPVRIRRALLERLPAFAEFLATGGPRPGSLTEADVLGLARLTTTQDIMGWRLLWWFLTPRRSLVLAPLALIFLASLVWSGVAFAAVTLGTMLGSAALVQTRGFELADLLQGTPLRMLRLARRRALASGLIMSALGAAVVAEFFTLSSSTEPARTVAYGVLALALTLGSMYWALTHSWLLLASTLMGTLLSWQVAPTGGLVGASLAFAVVPALYMAGHVQRADGNPWRTGLTFAALVPAIALALFILLLTAAHLSGWWAYPVLSLAAGVVCAIAFAMTGDGSEALLHTPGLAACGVLIVVGAEISDGSATHGAVLGALGIGMALFLSTEWWSFVLARTSLGLGGQVPYRLVNTLTQARKFGVLRYRGSEFAFRYEQLEEILAPRSPDQATGGTDQLAADR